MDLSYSEDQTWISPPGALQYMDETAHLVRFYEGELAQNTDIGSKNNLGCMEDPQEHSIAIASANFPTRASNDMEETSSFQDEPHPYEKASIIEHYGNLDVPLNRDHGDTTNIETLNSDRAVEDITTMEVDHEMQSNFGNGQDHVNDENLNISHIDLSSSQAFQDRQIWQLPSQFHSIADASPLLESPNSNASFGDSGDITFQNSPLTPREALLMRNFIENMALWADVTDPERHFEVVVPRRAIDQPVLRYAIFAFSSRHVSRRSNYEETEAVEYHNKCLEHLIPILSNPKDSMNEDILAAVAILRQYEELDGNGFLLESKRKAKRTIAFDQRCHLIGTTRMLNSVAMFASSGGLGEAAAWLCLREDIYVSLVSQQPLRTHLENYHESKIFKGDDDISMANQMVFLLAKLLGCVFHPARDTDVEKLHQISREIGEWASGKGLSFAPILFHPRSKTQRRAFPEIWMLLPSHVVGMQYYHIAKIVLAISEPRASTTGYASLREGRELENKVRNHLRIVLGLSISNKRCQNTMFTARHALSVWGGVLRDELDQEAALSFLLQMEETTGWRMEGIIQSLKEQWVEDYDGV
ncbi:hypothetical protein BP5796_10868 [Coleophoma crateriformis]|uniref:ARCA protein n=1 Tax=Coleophoma crateriformis TaxID=565419 RepID=A0A3D8QL61_9HELO|nr:hypothetical protein BP5796_10868 [Coleophoma crateriformis]